MNMRFIGASLILMFSFVSIVHADIVIGVISPLTGPFASFGEQVRNGVEAAVAEINKKGGILGNKVTIKNADDGSEPKQGVSAANQLIGEGVRFVVGPPTSGVAFPTSDVLAENRVLMVTPSASAVDLTTRGLKNIFRTCGRDDQQAEVAAKYVLDNFKHAKIAIFHDKSVYGKDLADVFKKTLNTAGIYQQIYDTINPGEKDFSALISHIKESNIDIVYFGGYAAEAGLLVRQFADYYNKGHHPILVGPDSLSSSEFWIVAGRVGDGTLFTNSLEVKDNPDSMSVIKQLKSRGVSPEPFTLNSYAAVQVIKAGIEKVGNDTDSEAVAEAIRNASSINTVIGKIAYRKTGDLVSQNYSIYTWKGGKVVSVTNP